MHDSKPLILLTNDDGIHAAGLRCLWQALNAQFDIVIVAPAVEQSSVGTSITIRTPLRIERMNWPGALEAWSVTGTPADCVKLARSTLLKKPPALIVSGVNRGSNAGRNVLYSGTVGGVIEGLMQDIPGIAFSTEDYHSPDYAPLEAWITPIVTHTLKHPMPKGTLLNVNFPEKLAQTCKGIKMTRQGKQYWSEAPQERQHPTEGHSYYWLGSQLASFDEHEDSDIYWLKKGYITAVPLHFHELTDHAHLKAHKKHFEDSLGR